MKTTTANAAPTAGRRSFGDWSVNLKIVTAISLAVAVAVLVGIVALRALSAASAAAQSIYTSNLTSVQAVGEIRSTMATARLDVANHAISQDRPTMVKYERMIAADMQAVEAAIAAYEGSDPTGDPTVIAELRADWQSYSKIVQDTLVPASQNNNLRAWQTARDTQVSPLMGGVGEDLVTLTKAESDDAKSSAQAAQSGYESGRLLSISLLVLGCLLALGLGLLVARSIVHSLTKVKGVCDGLADGDLTRTTGLTSRDEPGLMGRSLDTAMVKLRQTVSTIDQSAASLASASEQMSSTSEQIAASAQAASAQAETVSAATEEISRSVDSVSAGSEEMGAAIREISQNASEAARVAAEAVDVTAATAATMNKLGESSIEIGNVIKTITAIAEQTNLLALNATIEAARAGELGKGFAVVASEVKDLAQETARATEDISRRVEAIQSDTGGAVTAIEEITRVIARISDFQTTIASAVEEQTATTAEMSRSVNEAAAGTSEIAENISGVAEAARLTSEGVTETRQATTELSRMSADLTALVSNFRY
ncbi:methyl-accepting chemotaxis protein [Actinoplanes sp. M2I2]|uniref:methyl-accepting chemotaxis protein n=1 Tax=Actinoplanes sp. M2I2 TaxID=1734444 RepID=UPI0020202A5E|nr:methyl-accepting chemotaxis protein [Actinoplanes sp. M2I2]